jgi:hypothetical protein
MVLKLSKYIYERNRTVGENLIEGKILSMSVTTFVTGLTAWNSL